MTGIPLRKIYIDSRNKTGDSVSASDFRFQLNKNTFMPTGSEFCIDEINVPYAWNTIEPNTNDTMYIVMYPADISGPPTYASIIITPKRYNGTDLATELSAKLNQITNGWTVAYNSSANT